MDGQSGPLRSWERLYWGVFVSAIAYFLFTRLSGKDPGVIIDPEVCILPYVGYLIRQDHLPLDEKQSSSSSLASCGSYAWHDSFLISNMAIVTSFCGSSYVLWQ